MPSGTDQLQAVNLLNVYNIGQNVVIAQGQSATGTPPTQLQVGLNFEIGLISGASISWRAPVNVLSQTANCTSLWTLCGLGIRHVSVTLTTDPSGNIFLAFSYNKFYWEGYSVLPGCGVHFFSELDVLTQYNLLSASGFNIGRVEGHSFAASASGQGCLYPDDETSVILPADNQGRVFTVYQFGVYKTDSFNRAIALDHTELHAIKIGLSSDPSPVGPVEPVETLVTSNPEFSAVIDSNYVPHVVYVQADGNVYYAYRLGTVGWIRYRNILSGPARYPTITTDQSTDTLYLMAVQGSSIVMRSRPPLQSWYDQSNLFPVTNRVNPSFLTSNFLSASATNATSILLVWTEGKGPYNATFASIPIPTVWSPYGPKDPWDGNGLVPYGQYFASLGEYVSPSTGMLTLRQGDLSVPGRGLNLEITRIYTEPGSFLGGTPYNFERYPWAPLGDGWQLNFPWMNNISYPSFVHLWDGEGYRIPNNFWNLASSFYENHQGEHFRMLRNSTGVFLYTKTGVAYVFDPTNQNRLTRILDPVGNNITFAYNRSLISSITDPAGRRFLFCYTGGLLSIVEQAGGSCGAELNLIRKVSYAYSGLDLVLVTDPAGRKTSYQYTGVADPKVGPWLLSSITYPTKWYSSYSYTQALLGTQAASYRVFRQMVNASSTPTSVRWFQYIYTQGPGDQVTNSIVLAYNGTSRVPVTNTTYVFSFALTPGM
jgi:YD repeat-containing protein